MLIVTINEVPGKKIEALGVVRGSTVQSRNLGHDIMAGFRTLVGGEVTDYAEMLTEARQIATGRMAKECGGTGSRCCGWDALRLRQRHAGCGRGHCLRNGGEICMSAKEKQGFSLYFLIAFGLAWLCQVGGCMALLQQKNAVLYQLALIATMFCPLLAVLLVQKCFCASLSVSAGRCRANGGSGLLHGLARQCSPCWAQCCILPCSLPAGLFLQLAGSRLRR